MSIQFNFLPTLVLMPVYQAVSEKKNEFEISMDNNMMTHQKKVFISPLKFLSSSSKGKSVLPTTKNVKNILKLLISVVNDHGD